MKTRKSIAKRFKVTGEGKILRRKTHKSHLLGKKSRKRKRHLSQETRVDKGSEKYIRRAMGVRIK